jgi:GNAT superfamily N-acetyltransferase
METNDVEIRALGKENARDFFTFFDGPAFADNAGWAGCYCYFFRIACGDDVWCARSSEENREASRGEILEGKLTGFLAYRGSTPVAFCHAGPKAGFPRLAADSRYLTEETAATYSIVCFIVKREERKKGIATAFLRRLVAEAEGKGFAFLESYPSAKNPATDADNYRGPESMYRKFGFSPFRETGGVRIFRKVLGR